MWLAIGGEGRAAAGGVDSEANRVNGVDEVSGGARTAAGGGVGGESPPRRRVRRAPTLPTTRAMLLRFMLQPDFQCNSYSLCRQHGIRR